MCIRDRFYLLWPALLALVGVKRALRAAMAVVVILPFGRVILWTCFPNYRDFMDHSFETVADAMAIGGVLAGMRAKLWERTAYRAVLESRAFVLAPVVILALNAQEPHPLAFMLGAEPLMNLAIALAIDWTVRNHQSWVVRVLDSKPSRFIGVRSYSLYLWQEPFLDHRVTSMVTTFPLNLGLAFVASLISYAAVERPFQRLRTRFAR